MTVDNSSAEMHTTIYSISESPPERDVIWVGTDDGNVQLTRDGGKTWTNVVANVPGAARRGVGEVGRGEPPRRGDRVRGVRPPHVRRHDAVGLSHRRLRQDLEAHRGPRTRACAATRTSSRRTPSKPSCSSWARRWACGSRPTAAGSWAEFKGGDFPSVAVREVPVQTARARPRHRHPRPRDLDRGRPHSPARADGGGAREGGRVPAGAADPAADGRHRGLGEGDASSWAEPAARGAVITYYQRTRHLFGPIKLEILDASGKVVDTIPATKRRGINRVSWPMRVPPPRVPRAAQVAFGASQGPRVLPGTYTVRLTKAASPPRRSSRSASIAGPRTRSPTGRPSSRRS